MSVIEVVQHPGCNKIERSEITSVPGVHGAVRITESTLPAGLKFPKDP